VWEWQSSNDDDDDTFFVVRIVVAEKVSKRDGWLVYTVDSQGSHKTKRDGGMSVEMR
jgi:hypothetical protein